MEELIERVKKLELRCEGLKRRMHKTVTGLLAPGGFSQHYPIVPEDRIVFRYMTPLEGTAKGLIIRLRLPVDRDKDPVYATISVISTAENKERVVTLQPGLNYFSADLSFKHGDLIVVKLSSTAILEVSDIWTAVEWVPSLRECAIKEQLIDALDRSEEAPV